MAHVPGSAVTGARATDTTSGIHEAGAFQGLALIFISLLPTLAIVSLVPNLPQFFARFRDVPHSELLVPMIITLPSLCIALFSPFAGAIADFWGRRRLLLAAILMYTLVGVLPAFLNSLYAILATRFVIGIAEAAILTCQNALMGDYFAGAKRQRWLGLLSVIGPVAAGGLVLAGGMLGSIDWRGPFYLYLLGAPMLLWAAFVIFEPRPAGERAEAVSLPKNAFPWSAARVVALVTIGISVLYFVQAIQLGRMFGDHGVDSPARISIFVTIASVGVVLGGWVFSRMTKVSVRTRFVLIFLALAIGYTGIGLAPNAVAAVPFALVAQFANGMTIPTLIGWALGKFDFDHRGRGMGVWGGCFFVGTFLSPLLVTLIGNAAGSFLHTVAAIGIGCFVLAAITWMAAARTPEDATADASH